MIEVKALTKKYASRVAVNDVSFSAGAGEVIGFLGPNGAGKTTTMNMLAGYSLPTAGEIKISGFDMSKEEKKAKASLGYLPDTPPLYQDMLVGEYLVFAARLKKIKNAAENIEAVMKATDISQVKGRLIKNLSKGYRQRIGLAQAMLGTPPVLILDEPTVGLDPVQIIEIRELIKELGGKQTIILSSHILSEVSATADRVLIMNKGEVREVSKNQGQGKTFALVKAGKDDILETLERNFPLFEINESTEPGCCEVTVSSEGSFDAREKLFFLMAGRSFPILLMKPADKTLEEIFLEVTGHDSANQEGA